MISSQLHELHLNDIRIAIVPINLLGLLSISRLYIGIHPDLTNCCSINNFYFI